MFARFALIAACLLSVACSAYRAGLVLNEAGQAQATGNFNEALRLYGEVSRLDPGQPAGPYGRGLALRELGRPKEALVAFREAMRVDPRFRFAHLELAITQSDLGSLEESAATLKAALARFPGDPDLEAEQRRLQAIQGSLHPRQ